VDDESVARRTLAVHLFNFPEDIYGEPFTVDFGRFPRREKKFESVEALKEKIYRDTPEEAKIWSELWVYGFGFIAANRSLSWVTVRAPTRAEVTAGDLRTQRKA